MRSVERFFKFARAVGDDGDLLVLRSALRREKMVKPRRCRCHFPVDVANHLAAAIVADRPAGDEVHMSPSGRNPLRGEILRKLGFVLFFG